jgi:hypothetical protein
MATGLLRRAEAAAYSADWTSSGGWLCSASSRLPFTEGQGGKISTLARSELATKWKSDRLTRTTFRGVGCSGWKPHHRAATRRLGAIQPLPLGGLENAKTPRGGPRGQLRCVSYATKGSIVSLPSPFGPGKPNPSTSTTDPLIQALVRLLAEGRLALRPRDAAKAIGVSERTLWAT